MTPAQAKANSQAQIRALVEGWAGAVRAKDVDRILTHYAEDVVSFDLGPPLQFAGTDAIRRSLQAWFPTFVGPVGYEVHDLQVTAGDDIAFSRSFNRITGKRTDGEDTDVWVRATVCYRRIQGRWIITHEHVSVPFYMDGSFRAAVDLKP
jgi:uncharacterized protein (TIGR02246 family)